MGNLEATRGREPISYRGALLSTLLHATVYVFIQSAECTGTDCKWNGIKKNLEAVTRQRLTKSNWEDLNCWVMHPVARVSVNIYIYIYKPPYATNVGARFIVHFLHYMFRPLLVAIFRWFVPQKIFEGSYCICQRIRCVSMLICKLDINI
jgi:hypothetical protein